MNCYRMLARHYDALTEDVDYPGWADFLERLFRKSALPVNTVLDLACGTGTLTLLLAERGYETIGADGSADMLAMAAAKPVPEGSVPPVFLCQTMTGLDLYGTVDAVVCCLDSVNYLTRPGELERMLERVHLFLAPGGLFVFDINSPRKLREMDGEMFIDEREDVYCVWRADYSPRNRICTFGIDLFEREGERWSRSWEEHREYAYECGELEDALAQAGFDQIRMYGDRKLRPPRPEEQRIFFTARRGEKPCRMK